MPGLGQGVRGQFTKKQLSKGLISFLILLILSCSPDNHNVPQDGPPAYGDVIMMASIGDASNLIPMLASDSASHEVAGFIYNGLIKYDKDYNIVGDLAESWDITDEGKVIRFHLKKGVKWHDGKPLTAHDVLFTYKTIIDPKTPTAYAEDYKLVKDARVIDDYTFEVRYDKPFAPALISWGIAVLPEHLLKGVDIATTELARSPIGTGPFRFKRWEVGSKIVLEVNDSYFEPRPYLNGINYAIIPDQTTQFMELKAGSIDIMGLSPIQYLRQTDDLERKGMYKKYKYLADGYTYLGFNLKRRPFDNKNIRQAIAYAIDKEEIIKGVLLGLGMPATGPYKPGTVWYDEDVKKYPFNKDKALALLAQEGFADHDGDGIIDKDGKPFEFTIITNQGNPLREKTAQIIQQRLKALGIKVNVRVVEWTVFLKEFVDKSNFDAVILGWNIVQDPDLYTVWHSESELNFIGYKSKEMDKLLDDGRHTFDQKKRKACYDRIQEILAEDQPYVFLYVPYSLPIVSARFKGIEPAPAGIMYNLEDWYVPTVSQRHHVVP
jgi:peptide/nickel transport system substrate-binding protein